MVHAYIEKICEGENLSQNDCQALFVRLVSGELEPIQISALLIALKAKGETPEEIAGAAAALRASARPFPRPDYAYADTCGTGGDMSNTFNISTAVAFIAAAMGIPIAKHGNRSISSNCGSADVLETLGVRIDVPPQVARNCLDEVGICFLFAPAYHSGMRFALPVRQALKTRTVFNIIGPLVNPSRPSVQIMGVYDPARCVPIARTLGLLSLDAALVVHGAGLDEIALHDTTIGALYRDGTVTEIELSPAAAGLPTYPLKQLEGGDAQHNAALIRQLLAGQGDEAHEAVVALNAGALAWVFGKVDSVKQGCALALETIKSGRGTHALSQLIEVTNDP